MIRELVNTPFTYLLHRKKKIEQKITIIAQDKTEIKSPEKQSKIINPNINFDSSARELFPPIHNKKVREKKRNSISV